MRFESYTPVSFFSFYHYIIASPSSNQFIAIISFHQNEKATINHNLFSSLGGSKLRLQKIEDAYIFGYMKKKSNDTLRNFELTRNSEKSFNDLNRNDLISLSVKLNITVLSAKNLPRERFELRYIEQQGIIKE